MGANYLIQLTKSTRPFSLPISQGISAALRKELPLEVRISLSKEEPEAVQAQTFVPVLNGEIICRVQLDP